MNKIVAASLLAAAALIPTAAFAQTDAGIQSAETRAQLSPRDGGAQIELAQAYRNANRPADAVVAYRRALTLDNEMMETRNGDSIWSHKVAKLALANSEGSAVASR